MANHCGFKKKKKILKVKGIFKMLTFLPFLNDIKKKRNELPPEILSQFNFMISILTLEPKWSEFYSDCINAFCLLISYV